MPGPDDRVSVDIERIDGSKPRMVRGRLTSQKQSVGYRQ